MSNCQLVHKENVKKDILFLDCGPLGHHHVVDRNCFHVLRAGMALKAQISSSKIDFGSKFVKNNQKFDFTIFVWCRIFKFCFWCFFGFGEKIEKHKKLKKT